MNDRIQYLCQARFPVMRTVSKDTVYLMFSNAFKSAIQQELLGNKDKLELWVP